MDDCLNYYLINLNKRGGPAERSYVIPIDRQSARHWMRHNRKLDDYPGIIEAVITLCKVPIRYRPTYVPGIRSQFDLSDVRHLLRCPSCPRRCGKLSMVILDIVCNLRLLINHMLYEPKVTISDPPLVSRCRECYLNI